MGCPGTPVTAGFSGIQLGDTIITQSYPAPNLWNGYGLSLSTINSVLDNQSNPSGLDTNGSCSCCCSGLNGGLTPTWSHFYQYINSSITPISESTWPTEQWLPGGSTGIYMNNVGDKFYFFNVGQVSRCGQIGAGLYDLSPARTNTFLATFDVLDHVMDHFLLGSGAPWYVETDPNFNGGYSAISLCIPCFQIGSDPDVADTCPPASCANPMDYGTAIPTTPIAGPGHNLVAGCGSGTVWQTCNDDPCSPNGLCLGPPSTPAPTGCIQDGSPLTNSPADNVCFDCAGKPLFNPCYGATTNNPTNYGVWDMDDNWVQSGDRNGFDCGNTQNGDGSWGSYSSAGGDYYADYKQDPSNWDSCCMYKQYGCTNPFYANFNAIASLDCAGQPDPGDLTWYGSDPLDPASFGQVMCSQASWLNGGYAQITDLGGNNFSWSVPLLDPVTGAPILDPTSGAPIISSQGTASQPGGTDVPCTSLTVNGSPNPGGHPLSWSKTGYASADQCCCNNDGCTDAGVGGTLWDNTGNPPPNGGPNNVYPPLGPGSSPVFNTAGGYEWLGTDPTYYQGYIATIGSSSPTTISSGPVAASNYCAQCSGDCNGDPVGTFNPGWADCCWYQIPGCMDSTGGPNPDIFGTGPTYLVWNYNPLATYDDGSCFYQEPIQGCIDDGGLGLSNIMGPYLAPTYAGIPANNFDPDANIMAMGTCTWNEGCPDPLAVNYDPCADPNVLADVITNAFGWNCIVTDVNGIALPGFYPSVPNATLCNYNIPGAGPGCMDPQALNFNPLATQGCGGLFPPLDFTCCTYPVEGCTDPNAWNYNALAVIDDGSCEYQINPFQEGVNFLDGTKVLLCRDPLTKEEVLMNVCEPTEIQSEIFIERGKQTVFEPNQRLGEIKTMGGLVNHGYGYYKIKKQE